MPARSVEQTAPRSAGDLAIGGPLAGRVAIVSGGGRGLGRSFCLALARQGAKVVVNNRSRVTDADGRGPAGHVAAEIVAAGVERWGRPDRAPVVEWGTVLLPNGPRLGAHTGKRLLETHMARSKGAAYAEYVRRASGFIPWPPR